MCFLFPDILFALKSLQVMSYLPASSIHRLCVHTVDISKLQRSQEMNQIVAFCCPFTAIRLHTSDKASMQTLLPVSLIWRLKKIFVIYPTVLSLSATFRCSAAEELFLRSVQNLYALVPNTVTSDHTTSFCHPLQINLVDLLLVCSEDAVDHFVSESPPQFLG